MISQRDIVEVAFPLPQGNLKHPVIVLSSNEVINMEQAFVAMMLTTAIQDDEFSFDIRDSMLTKPLSCKCQARLHLVSFFLVDQVIKNSHYNTRIKQEFFEELIKQMNLFAFKVDMKIRL